MAKIKDLRGKTPRTNDTRPLSKIKNIARHHSATTSGDWASFWRHWRDVRGWGTGGYHEIILRDGTVELCYNPEEITNGVANLNSTVYNICLVGNGSFTVAQEKAWKERCTLMLKLLGLPISAVKGHNEFPGTNTACPGIDMNYVRKALETVEKPVYKGKTAATVAQEVIAGKWGNGAERMRRLNAAGYDAKAVQSAVNAQLSGKPSKLSVEAIAREVIAGKWGNGSDRKKALKVAGYNYAEVQRKVNQLLS